MGDAPSPSVLYFDPKKTTENFARLCHFLVTICGDIMRDVLSHYINPANLRLELDKNRSKLQKITNAQEKDFLYPPHSSTCFPQIRSGDLDISLLYKILRNICNIPTHKAGWGNQPVSGDFSLAACIERIRILRNSISGHSTNGTVDDVSCEDYWRELRTSVVKIEEEVIGSYKYEREIDHLHDCDLNPTKSKDYVAQIRRNTGEIIMKRERFDLVEEEANAKRVRLESLEKNHAELKADQEQRHVELKAHQEQRHVELKAYLTGLLTAVKTDIVKELKANKLQLQQDGDTAQSLIHATNDAIPTETSAYTFRKLTTIECRHITFSMESTLKNKCWLVISCLDPTDTLESDMFPKLYLSEIDRRKEIKIPKDDFSSFSTSITTNDDGDAVYVDGKSVRAVRENGKFLKLFGIDTVYEDSNWDICCLRSGNYLIRHLSSTLFTEYDREGVSRRTWNLPEECETFSSRVNQNINQDYIFTDSFSFRIYDKRFNLKHMELMEDRGVVKPVLNRNGELLYGHGQSIDLLDDRGIFIKKVYKTHRLDKITNIAYSNNGTIWIRYESDEMDILKLDISFPL